MVATRHSPAAAEDPVYVHTGERVVSAAEACVPILDHGFLFGDSVYEVVRTAGGRPFMLAEHMDRLRRSAAMIYFEPPWDDAEVGRRIGQVQERLGDVEGYHRIVATRGPGPISLLPDGCDQPGLYVIGKRLGLPPAEHYEHGCRVAVVPRLRNDPRALDPRAKTGNYMNNMLGMIEARRAGADDALFLNADGHLTEATTANVWLVEGGAVVTPRLEEGLLAGITRQWLLGALPAAGIATVEDVVDRARLDVADEVFLSGTVKGILPVTVIDGRALGDGRPGPVTRRAADLYRDALCRT